MVSETTVKLLQEVGELKVFQVDDSDHAKIIEKYGFAQDQLSNPLQYQHQVSSPLSFADTSVQENIERSLQSASRSTIQSQQSLTAESDCRLQEEKRRMTTEGSTSKECDADDAMFSENEFQEIRKLHDAAESENALRPAIIAKPIEKEEIEKNLGQNESKAPIDPDLVNRNVIRAGTSQSVEVCGGKERFGSALTPVECEEIGKHNRFTTTELVARYSANIYHVAKNKSEQVRLNLSDGDNSSEQEEENCSVVAKEPENKHKDTVDLMVDRGTKMENKTKAAEEGEKPETSRKGIYIEVESLDLNDA